MARLSKAQEEDYKKIFRRFHELVQAHDVGTKRAYEEALEQLKNDVSSVQVKKEK